MEFIFEDSQDENNRSDAGSGKIVYMDNPGLFIDMFYDKNRNENDKQSGNNSGLKKLIFKSVSVVICIVFIILFTWSKVKSSPEFRLRQMLSQGQYDNCIKSALLILEKDPGNEKFQTIAEESFIGKVLNKGWAEKLEKGFFADAQNILTQGNEYIKNNNEVQSIIKLLMWIIDIEEYYFSKKTDTQLVIFKDEILMESLIDRWNNEKAGIRSLFNRFLTQDKLEKIRHRVYQHLDMLQTQYYLYYKDILAFKNTIKDRLDTNQHESLASIIDEFHKKYPGIGGTKEINEDMSNYIKIVQAVKSRQLYECRDLMSKMNFQTGPFADKIKRILAANGLDKENNSPDKSPSIPVEHDYSIVKISELKIMPDLSEKSEQFAMKSKIISDNQ